MSYPLRKMREFKDYEGKVIVLDDESYQHIVESHSEITLKQVEDTLIGPIEVRESTTKRLSILYYSLKIKTDNKIRYICVVVKRDKEDKYFIETAMTSSNLKKGKTIYKKRSMNNDFIL